jgi:hypothetical protein
MHDFAPVQPDQLRLLLVAIFTQKLHTLPSSALHTLVQATACAVPAVRDLALSLAGSLADTVITSNLSPDSAQGLSLAPPVQNPAQAKQKRSGKQAAARQVQLHAPLADSLVRLALGCPPATWQYALTSPPAADAVSLLLGTCATAASPQQTAQLLSTLCAALTRIPSTLILPTAPEIHAGFRSGGAVQSPAVAAQSMPTEAGAKLPNEGGANHQRKDGDQGGAGPSLRSSDQCLPGASAVELPVECVEYFEQLLCTAAAAAVMTDAAAIPDWLEDLLSKALPLVRTSSSL